jgi:hypothetical protein
VGLVKLENSRPAARSAAYRAGLRCARAQRSVRYYGYRPNRVMLHARRRSAARSQRFPDTDDKAA